MSKKNSIYQKFVKDILKASDVPTYDQYAADVLRGKRAAAKDEINHVKRYVRDLVKSKLKKYKYKFDRDLVDRVLVIAKMIRHTSGEFYGKLFQLQPFQAFYLANIFGWLKKSDGKRRFIRSYFSVARKNGKTELKALVVLLLFLFDGEMRANIVTAATQKEQALECFEAAKIMIEFLKKESPMFDKRIDIIRNSVTDLATKSSLKPLSTDRGRFDGKNIHLSIVDEYHAHPNSNLLDVLASSTGSRSQPLTAIITTAGFDTESACAKLERIYKKVIDEEDDLEEERTFVMIFTLDEEDEKMIADSPIDEIDMSIFSKANPCMGVSLYEDIYLADLVAAKNMGGSKWIEFLTKKLNVWTTQFSLWIPPAIIKARARDYTIEDLKGRMCFGGLDLASRRDLSSFYLHFPPTDDDVHRTIGWNFVPKDMAKERAVRDRVKYLDWIRDGDLIATEGNITDYNYIKHKIIEVAEIVDIEEIAYDRFNSSQLIIDLMEEGFTCQGFGQGFISMNTPTKEIDAMYRNDHVSIVHNGDPLLMWAYKNAVIKTDPADNWKVDKSKSTEKIDPVVAQIMALGQYMDWRKRNEVIDIGEVRVF